MNPLKRIQISIGARFDEFIRGIENHAEIAKSAYERSKKAEAKARLSLQKLQKDLLDLKSQKDSALIDKEKWELRAAELKAKDRSRALECMKRRASAIRRVEFLETKLKEQGESQKALESYLESVSEKLESLRLKMNTLRTRSYCRDAQQDISNRDYAVEDLEDLMERWDEHLQLYEFSQERDVFDHFESEFKETEEKDLLEKELDALVV